MADPSEVLSLIQKDETVMGHIYRHIFGRDSSIGIRLVLIVVLAVLVHTTVKIIRHISEWVIYKSHAQKSPLGFVTQLPKFITVTRLIVSSVTFGVYFFAFGLILQELGVNLTAYLASATVIGLAISFGSQGLVQDIVSGLTLIFWDAMDVGDMVELTGATSVMGRVEEIGLRFTKLVNFYNQEVFVPNRTIANVSRFPHGGADAVADPQIPFGADPEKAVPIIRDAAKGMWMQFGAIILSEPSVGKVETAQGGGWNFVRVHFKIWPGQGNLIESVFRQQAVKSMKAFDPAYADWQVPVTYRAAGVPVVREPWQWKNPGAKAPRS
jgi:moderate conductance mechanosensitive channel